MNRRHARQIFCRKQNLIPVDISNTGNQIQQTFLDGPATSANFPAAMRASAMGQMVPDQAFGTRSEFQ